MHNSLMSLAPEIAESWDYHLNSRSIAEIVSGSNYRAAWKCKACDYSWTAAVKDRVSRRSACPRCAHARRVKGSLPTFAQVNHPLLAAWDHKRNSADGLFPEDVTLGSGLSVHWICNKCPEGRMHRFQAMPRNRTRHKASDCPICESKLTCVCNSLAALCPRVAAEFDIQKNGCSPSEITAMSNQMVWWKRQDGTCWQQVVSHRTKKKHPPHSS